jgi:ubiquinone biosynthesis protein COQ9
MAQPAYIPQSVAELGRLSDEIWFLAGDTSVDTSWYTKRGSLAALFSAAEVYQTQDKTPGRVDTERFVDSRLSDIKAAAEGASAVAEWAGFTARSLLNVLRSKGVRI